MKRINLFARFVLTPFFILISGFVLYNAKDFNKATLIVSIFAEIILTLYMFNSYSYSSKHLQSKFFGRKKIYELNEVTFVRKSNLGFIVFHFGSKYQKESINFLLQKKNKLELFEYIKNENPSCIFKI